MSQEIRSWQERGLSLGTDRYRRYLALFGSTTSSCVGQAVCDYGCGPFGGVLSVLRDVGVAFPVDILAEEYNLWGYSAFPIHTIDAEGRADVPSASCDVAFCLQCLDHTAEPSVIVADLFRILKPGGVLRLFVHLRERTKGHYPLTVSQTLRLLAPWEVCSVDTGRDIPNNEPELEAVWVTVLRP